MKVKMTAILLALSILVTIPLCVMAFSNSKSAKDGGELSFGVLEVSGRNDTSFELRYLHCYDFEINSAVYSELYKKLSDCGLEFSAEQLGLSKSLLERKTFLAVVVENTDGLNTFLAEERLFYSSGSDDEYTHSLQALSDGFELYDAGIDAAISLAKIFPELQFDMLQSVALPYYLSSEENVELSGDSLYADIYILPPAQEIEREVFGNIYTTTLVSTQVNRYTVERCEGAAASRGIVAPWDIYSDVSDSDLAPGSVTTTTTTTTTASEDDSDTTTTKSTTTTTTTTTAKTSTTTTTTTTKATTTTTTAARDDESDDDYSDEDYYDPDVYVEIEECVGHVVTEGGKLNLRRTPYNWGKIIWWIPNGTEVTIIGRQGKWYHVKLENGLEGYCFEQYIETK